MKRAWIEAFVIVVVGFTVIQLFFERWPALFVAVAGGVVAIAAMTPIAEAWIDMERADELRMANDRLEARFAAEEERRLRRLIDMEHGDI